MPLNRELIDMPFAGGIDLKTDPAQVQMPKLLICENGDFTALKAIKKRACLQPLVIGAPGANLLATFKNELIMAAGTGLYGWSPSVNALVQKSAIYAPLQLQRAPVANVLNADTADCTVNGNFVCTVWSTATFNTSTPFNQTAGTVSFMVTDEVSGTEVGGVSGMVGTGLAGQVKVLPYATDYNATFVVFYTAQYLTGFAVYAIEVLARTGAIIAGPSVVSPLLYNGAGFDFRYDVCNAGGVLVIAAATPLSGNNYGITLSTLVEGPGTIVVSSSISYTGSTIATSELRSLSVSRGASSRNVLVGWSDSVTLYAQTFRTSDLAGVTGLNTTAWDNVQYITGYGGTLWAGVGQTPPFGWATIAWTPGGAAPTVTARHVRPHGKVSAIDSNLYLPLMHEAAYQPTIFLALVSVGLTPTPGTCVYVSRVLAGQAYWPTGNIYGSNTPIPRRIGLPECTGGLFVALRNSYGDQYSGYGGLNAIVIAGPIGVETYQFSTVLTSGGAKLQAANNLFLGGGLLNSYDGVSVQEHGFLLSPEAVTLIASYSGTSSSGTLTQDAHQFLYAYQFLYAWDDAQGQTHRSGIAPYSAVDQAKLTIELSASITDGDPEFGTAGVTMDIPTLQQTNKQNVRVEIYRTQDANSGGGTIYYLAGTVPCPAGAYTVYFQDHTPDSTLQYNAQLYTTGGVLSNDPPPACNIAVLHRNRVWCVDAAYPDDIFYSDTVIPVGSGAQGQPVEFSEALQLKLDSSGTPVTALASMDEKLICFQRNKIFYVMGDGPDATGNLGAGSFQVFQLPHELGAVQQGSVAVCSLGVIFQSLRGIYLLDRSLGISYIGKDIDDGAGQLYASATVHNNNQILFADPTNYQILMYDALVNQWCVWPVFANVEDQDSGRVLPIDIV